jgi:hypothetical protein
VAVEVLEVDGRPGRRPQAGLVVAVALVLAALLGGFLLVQRTRAQVFTPEEVRHALAASVPNRLAPFPLPAPGLPGPSQPVVAPDQCRPLLLRPWLVDAWPADAVSGSQTGAPGVDSYPSSEAVAFTTRGPAEAERIFTEARSALESRACDRATVSPAAPARRPFTVTVEQQRRDPARDGACAVLSYVATASPAQPGSPESVTTELLRYGNTISLLVQLSEDDALIFAGSYIQKDGERPALTTLCRELQGISAAR